MEIEWTKRTLKEVCTKIGSGQTPRGGKESYKGGRFALVRSQNIYNQGFSETGLVYINDSQADQLSNVEIQSNDVFINITGDSVTRCCMVPEEILPARVNQHVAILRADNKVLDGGFLRYFLISPKIQRTLLSLSSGGATRKALTKSMLESCEIVLPTMLEQKAISNILGNIDKKIAINKKNNDTLEEIAKTLFKSWFIDFDPVKAKAEGRSTGLSDEISDLFPNNLKNQNISPIPEGWSWRRLGDFITLGKGVSYQGKFLSDSEGLPMINLGCFAGEGKFRDEKMKFYAGKYNDQHIANYRDILVANTDITQDRIILGSPIIMPKWNNHQKFLFSHHVFLLKLNEGKNDWSGFIFQSLLSKKFRHIAVGYATGTTVLALPKDGIMEYQIAVPPHKLVSCYEKYFKNLYDRIENNSFQNSILHKLRNTLLPKLISGELKIPNAEKIIEDLGI